MLAVPVSRIGMRGLLTSIVLGGLLVYSPIVLAAEDWVEVFIDPAGDRISVDQNSIQRSDGQVQYWEYRDLSAQTGSTAAEGQPSSGMMIYRSVDCTTQTSRIQRLVLFNQARKVVRRINYGATGTLTQSSPGSHTEVTIRYACSQSEPR